MTNITVQIPESLRAAIEEMAQRDGISIDQFIALATAEKLSALMTADYLGQRAKRGNRHDFEAALAEVPDVEPEPYDKLP
ncbi:MAG: toxin-antitoxin system HicB family antitoxin [Anaerolineae bacterium]|nr:toxin-antitoxin system HicB family antitoxin [Anaerolineae bacterium]